MEVVNKVLDFEAEHLLNHFKLAELNLEQVPFEGELNCIAQR